MLHVCNIFIWIVIKMQWLSLISNGYSNQFWPVINPFACKKKKKKSECESAMKNPDRCIPSRSLWKTHI